MIEWYTLLVGTIILSAAGSILEKKTLFKEHAMEFSTVFSIFAAVLALFLFPFANFNFPIQFWLLIFVLSWLDAIAFLFYAKASRHMEISSSSPLLAFSPVMTAILAFLILKESLTTIQMGGIGLILFGSYILEMRPQKSFKKEILTPFKMMVKSKYIHFIFFTLLLYAFSAIISRFLLNTQGAQPIDPLAFLLSLHLMIAVNLTILITIFHDGFKGIVHGIKSAWKWIGLMAVFVFTSRLLLVYAISFPAAKIALVIAVKRTSTVLSTFFGGEIFKDKNLKQRTIASIIMVIGAIILVI